jgi:antitoxin HigA-1
MAVRIAIVIDRAILIVSSPTVKCQENVSYAFGCGPRTSLRPITSSVMVLYERCAALTSMKTNKLPPIHPGEILREEFMKPRGLSQNALARALNVPPRRINEIVLEKRAITADTALRLARYFGTSAEMWTGLQADYDLRRARYEKQTQIERDVEPLALEPATA